MPDQIDKLSAELGAALKGRGWMIVTAESCTGGGVGEAITRSSGSSAWFDRGFITYSNAAKEAQVKVRAATLASFGAVSEEIAREMALGALAASNAQVCVSVTGVAGPDGGTADKPVGMACFAWGMRAGICKSQTCHFTGDRAEVRRKAIIHALEGVIELSRIDT